MTNPAFDEEVARNIEALGQNQAFRALTADWVLQSSFARYTYNFRWLGRPIIQFPQDMVAVQELIWQVKPDLVIETGIAHGGSLILSASLLAMLDWADAVESGTVIDPGASKRKVIGIDIDIRAHNRQAIEAHPMASMITMFQSSSIDPDLGAKIRDIAKGYNRVMVFLDSNHTHDHVLAELELYAPMVSKDSYIVVFDTVVDDMPDGLFPDRPWNSKNNPKTATKAYLEGLKNHPTTGLDGTPLSFDVDHAIENKIQITVAPHGFLRRL